MLHVGTLKELVGEVLLSVWPYRLVRWALGLLFLWAAVLKLKDPEAFGLVINDFGLIPESWIMPVAMGLPVLEVVAAIGLILDLRGSLGIIGLLLVLFMVIFFYALWLGLDIDCGCFGPGDPESRAYAGLKSALYRDFVMAAGVVYLYGWRSWSGVSPKHLFRQGTQK